MDSWQAASEEAPCADMDGVLLIVVVLIWMGFAALSRWRPLDARLRPHGAHVPCSDHWDEMPLQPACCVRALPRRGRTKAGRDGSRHDNVAEAGSPCVPSQELTSQGPHPRASLQAAAGVTDRLFLDHLYRRLVQEGLGPFLVAYRMPNMDDFLRSEAALDHELRGPLGPLSPHQVLRQCI